VKTADCRRHRGQAQESADLYWLANEAVEGNTSCKLDEQRRLAVLARNFDGPQRPRIVQVVFEFVLVREAFDP
jgi:hypothetical protein